MKAIQPIPESDFDLVEMKTDGDGEPTPHCKKHGAMNKITVDGFWRCITVSGFRKVKVGSAIGEKHLETICRAGCYW